MKLSAYIFGKQCFEKEVNVFDPKSYQFFEPYLLIVDGEVQLKTSDVNGDDIQLHRLPGDQRRVAGTIALMAASMYLPGALGATGPFSNILSAAMMLGGSVLLNSLLPPPALPNNIENSIKNPSPNYTISSQNNMARISEAIPSLYGRHKIYPDMAMQPYTEFVENEQYLHTLLCLGHGYVDIETLYIEDTGIENYTDIEWTIYYPNETVDMFENNIYTSSEVTGQELLSEDDENHDWIGPFAISGPGQSINGIGIDIHMPYGLYHQTYSEMGTTVWFIAEIRAIDSLGAPLFDGVWIQLMSFCISECSTNAINKTFYHDVPNGRYELRLKRSGNHKADYIDKAMFKQLKGYISDNVRSYGNVTLLGLKIKADENINDRNSRKINCIAQRRLPIYDFENDSWQEPQATRAITWTVLDILKNVEYGAGMQDVDIDFVSLHALHEIWENNNVKFDAVFDQKLTVWEALTTVCRVGRATPICIMGKVYFWRDMAQEIYRSIFTPDNIVKDTFSIEYIMPDKDFPDAIDVEYFSGVTWCFDKVTCSLSETPTKTKTIKLFGCVDKERAWHEGMYQLLSIFRRRKRIKFKTELDCSFLSFGDMIALGHDFLGGNFGEITAFYPDDSIDVDGLETDGLQEISIRSKKGDLLGPYAVTSINNNRVYVDADLSGHEMPEGEKPYVIGEFQSYIIQKISPVGSYLFEIEAVNVDNSIFDADNWTMPQISSDAPEPPVLPVIEGLIVKKYIDIVDLAYPPAPGDQIGVYHVISWMDNDDADQYEIHIMPENNNSWMYWDTITGNTIKIFKSGYVIGFWGTPIGTLTEHGVKTTSLQNARVRGISSGMAGEWSIFYGPINWMINRSLDMEE